ncbi:MAG TPA: leucine-rich repeat domain-containing protein, partial [Candidatus Saccharimonadales bacterium]|nr:leucine-rich repeat domain-containing protein [Candidatus Saccharimonadales bacterium]
MSMNVDIWREILYHTDKTCLQFYQVNKSLYQKDDYLFKHIYHRLYVKSKMEEYKKTSYFDLVKHCYLLEKLKQKLNLHDSLVKLHLLQILIHVNVQLNLLPPEIGQLSALQQLYLSHNQLSALPAEMGQLGALQSLSLSYNQLSALPPEIGQLGHLQYLDLTNNQLSELPQEMSQLSALQTLFLSN